MELAPGDNNQGTLRIEMLLPPHIFPARSLWIRPIKGAPICHAFLESRPLSSGLFEVSELPPSIFKSNQRPVGGTKFHPRVGGISSKSHSNQMAAAQLT